MEENIPIGWFHAPYYVVTLNTPHVGRAGDQVVLVLVTQQSPRHMWVIDRVLTEGAATYSGIPSLMRCAGETAGEMQASLHAWVEREREEHRKYVEHMREKAV